MGRSGRGAANDHGQLGNGATSNVKAPTAIDLKLLSRELLDSRSEGVQPP